MSAAIPPTDVPLPDKDDVQSWANNARVSIVPLKGAEDYDEWFISIEMQARILGLSKHFSGETPHSDDTDKYHAVLTSIVWQSLSQRMQRNLTHAGWNSRLPITRMMNFIKVDCGFEADIAIIELLARFSESKRSNFSTTRAWLDHHQDLWARINKIEPISDKVWISQTVQAVKDAFPQLHSSWRIKGFSKDLLHKSEMLQYLNYEANRPQDEQKIGFTTQRKRSRSSSKKPKSKKNNLSHDITLDCGCVIKPSRPTHLPEECWRLHPEKKPDHIKSRTPTTTASPDIVAAGANLSFMAVALHTILPGSTASGHITRDDCILDSGCNTHTFNDVKWFTYLNTRVSVKPIMASNGQHLSVTGVGTVRLPLGDGFVELSNAQFAPKAEVNMISPGLLRRGGVLMDGCNDQLVSTTTGLPVGKFQWKSNIATLILRDEQPTFNFAAITSSSITKQVEFGLLHRRLGHAGKDRIVKACKEAGIAIDPRSLANFQCPACLLAKAPQQIHRDVSQDSTHFLSRVFWDFIEHKPEGFGGMRYTLHAIDVHTHFHWVIPTVSRANAFKAVAAWKTAVENASGGYKVQCFHTDNATEFLSAKFRGFCQSEGIIFRTGAPYVPAHQGIVERAGRTLFGGGQVYDYRKSAS